MEPFIALFFNSVSSSRFPSCLEDMLKRFICHSSRPWKWMLLLMLFILPTLDSVKTVSKVHTETYTHLKHQDVWNPPKVQFISWPLNRIKIIQSTYRIRTFLFFPCLLLSLSCDFTSFSSGNVSKYHGLLLFVKLCLDSVIWVSIKTITDSKERKFTLLLLQSIAIRILKG